jgi:DNA-binding MarR family transcriptional regulator
MQSPRVAPAPRAAPALLDFVRSGSSRAAYSGNVTSDDEQLAGLSLNDRLVLVALAEKGPLDLDRLVRGFRAVEGVRLPRWRIRRSLARLSKRSLVIRAPEPDDAFTATNDGRNAARDWQVAEHIAAFRR